ncbi:hypothetical protein [Streptomyces hesseae]|uniref:Transferase n=1 Tax=Streptomyces hesseae TaxID=3075519 RepID=A0ABU2SQC5_9ACTN|nr:hypothetical protein [Streptomyces sp. DSM 40473]MDT0451198.1 hypothetical protein [Streptomyces sp. DSM 40473]
MTPTQPTVPERAGDRPSTAAAPQAPTTTPEESVIVSAPPLAAGAGNPSADCIADSAGGLTFDLDTPGRAADTHWSAALVLRLRGREEDGEEVRLPLTANGDGRLRAVLPSTVALPEGRWDVHLACGEDTPRRLLPGLADLRSLVDRRPGPSTSPLAVRIPYATEHGNLSLRSWQRAPHAEAGDVLVDPEGITVRGTLYRVEDPGAWLAGAVVEARRRRADLTVTAPLTAAEGQDFTFTLPFAGLCAPWRGGPEVWDLWLRGPEGTPVRLARILDDVVDKKHVFVYPARDVTAPYAPAQAGPYYTADNDLSVRIGECPPGAGR